MSNKSKRGYVEPDFPGPTRPVSPPEPHQWRTKTSIRDGSPAGRFVVDWEEAEQALGDARAQHETGLRESDYLSAREQRRLVCGAGGCGHPVADHSEQGCRACGTKHWFVRSYATSAPDTGAGAFGVTRRTGHGAGQQSAPDTGAEERLWVAAQTLVHFAGRFSAGDSDVQRDDLQVAIDDVHEALSGGSVDEEGT